MFAPIYLASSRLYTTCCVYRHESIRSWLGLTSSKPIFLLMILWLIRYTSSPLRPTARIKENCRNFSRLPYRQQPGRCCRRCRNCIHYDVSRVVTMSALRSPRRAVVFRSRPTGCVITWPESAHRAAGWRTAVLFNRDWLLNTCEIVRRCGD